MYQPLCVESSVSDEEATWLFNKAKEMNSIVEIGSWYGKSTHALLSNCLGVVYAVDHFQGSVALNDATHGRSGREEFFKNVGHFTNLKLLEMPSREAAKLFKDKSVDMVFIDAGHLYEEFCEDVTLWLPKVRKVICGHDISWPGVSRGLMDLVIKWTVVVGTMWEVAI